MQLRDRNKMMASMRVNGKLLKQIADEFGITESSVSYALKPFNIKRPVSEFFRCGHPKSEENTFRTGALRCRTCHNSRRRASK